MKRAENQKFSFITILLVILCGLSIALVGWRELLHHRIMEENSKERTSLEETLVENQSKLEENAQQLESKESQLTELGLNNQSLKDRISNLEAQRDHLRAENNNQVERAQALQSTLVSLENELTESRHKALQLESVPNTLAGELATARSRVAELESELDDRAGVLSRIPDQYEFSGMSGDQSVFAVNGSAIEQDQLPYAMHLCNLDGIILTGWIHQIDERQLMGHVLNWNQGASALVKGEKVFMLPKKSHEQHN